MSNNLYNSIRAEVTELVENYEVWLSKDICDDMVTVYKDNLLTYEVDELNKVYVMLEDKNPPASKDTICEGIIDNYKKRLDILKHIYSSITDWNYQIQSLNEGRLCRGTSRPHFNIDSCIDNGGVWLDTMAYNNFVSKLKSQKVHSDWRGYIDRLNATHESNMNKIKKIINHMKDMNNNVSSPDIDTLKEFVDHTIDKIDLTIEIYALIIANYTATPE